MAADHGKAFERRHAARIPHGKRIVRPDFGKEMPDGESPAEVWDCKDRKGIRVISWFREGEAKYSTYTGDRNYHVALHIPSEKTDYVLCKAERYAHLVWCEGKLELLKELGVGIDD